jgi:hypothetical protein
MLPGLAVWLLQDFLAVLASGPLMIPELFLVLMLYRSLYRSESFSATVWSTFLGGVIFDLRWLGFPGVTSFLSVSILLVGRWVWLTLPSSGRTIGLTAFFLWAGQSLVSLARLVLWGLPIEDVFRTMLQQQGYLLPVVGIVCVLIAHLERKWNA